MKEKIIVITGPTGVGKTSISLTLAKEFHGEIINCDASQVYKSLDIGTAKINPAETKGIKHHLLNIKNPNEFFSIKDYQELAREKITEITKKGKTPFLVGGSGLFIKATITDYDLAGPKRSEDFAEQYRHLSNEELHSLLAKKDRCEAEKLHPNNRRRVLRRLELILSEGEIPHQDPVDLYDGLIIVLNTDRDILYERINQRTLEMFSEGWVEEAKALQEQGINLNKVNAIGYRDISRYLAGEIAYNELIAIIQQQTRRYAKRQITWNNNQFAAEYLNVDYDNPQLVINQAKQIINNFLNN